MATHSNEMNPQPEQVSTTQQEASKFGKWLVENKKTAIVAGGTLAAATTLVYNLSGPSSNAVEAAPGSTNNGDPARMTSEQFNDLSPVEQLNYAAPKLNANMSGTAAEMSQALVDTKWGSYNLLNGVNFTAPSINSLPQDIWNQYALGAFQAKDTAKKGDVAEAIKLAYGVAEGNERTALIDSFRDSRPEIELGAVFNAQPTVKSPTSGSYDGVDAAGSLAITEFDVRLSTNTDVVKHVVARFEKGSTDDSSRWEVVQVKNLS